MAIGKEIKNLRESKNINQKALAGNQFSRSYISQIECGLVLPSAKAIMHIADVLNISPLQLVDKNTIHKLVSKEEAMALFIGARKAYLSQDYKKCTQVLPLLISMDHLIEKIDVIYSKIWLVDAFNKSRQSNKAYELAASFFDPPETYTRSELALAIKLLYYKGVILYDKGQYESSLNTFLFIEKLILDKHLDPDKTLIIDTLSRIQMLYESMGLDEKVKEYKDATLKFSKDNHLISRGTLRSINRFYRDHATDTMEEMVDYYESLIQIAELIGDEYRVSILHSSIVELYLEHNKLELLEESLEKDRLSSLKIKDPALMGYMQAFNLLFRGRYYVKLGKFDQALNAYTKAQAYISDQNYSKSIKLEIDSLYNYAELYYFKKEYESALLYIHMAESASLKNKTTVRDEKISGLKSKIEMCL